MEHHYLALGNFSSEEIGKVEKAWGRWNPENYPGFQSLDSGSLLLPALAQIHIHKYTNTSSSMFGVDGRRVVLKVILSLVEGSHLLMPSVSLFDIGVVPTTDLMFSQKFSPLSSLLEGGAATKKASKKVESGTGVRKN